MFIARVMKKLAQAFFNLLEGDYESRQIACAENVDADQIRALIWAEQMGLAHTKVHKLPCYRAAVGFPDEREIGEAAGYYFARME